MCKELFFRGKRKQKIMIYAQEAGGGNILALTTQDLLLDNKYDIDIVVHREGVKPFKEQGIPYKLLESFGYPIPLTVSDAVGLLSLLEPDYLYGAMGNIKLDISNGSIFQAARKMNIKSISVLDCWKGWTRFQGKNDPMKYAPDVLLVIDEYSKKRMIEEGFCEQSVIVAGHPVLSQIEKHFRKPEMECERVNLRNRYGIDENDFLLVFTSQMLNHYVESHSKREDYYSIKTEKGKVVERILNVLQDISKEMRDTNFVLLLRLHPKEMWQDTLEYNNSEVRVIVDKDISRFDLYYMADCFVGFDTMILAEASYARCSVILFRLHEIKCSEEINFVERASDDIKIAQNEAELYSLLKRIIYHKDEKIEPNKSFSDNCCYPYILYRCFS